MPKKNCRTTAKIENDVSNSSVSVKKTVDSSEISHMSQKGTLSICKLCVRQRLINGKPGCKDKNCDKFEYRDSVNYLCAACKKTCKQYAFIDILLCYQYEKAVTSSSNQLSAELST